MSEPAHAQVEDLPELEIKILLLGNDGEIQEGIRRLDVLYRSRILRIIKRTNPCLGPRQLVEDVYLDALVKVMERAYAGGYDGEGSLLGYVGEIARNRARELAVIS